MISTAALRNAAQRSGTDCRLSASYNVFVIITKVAALPHVTSRFPNLQAAGGKIKARAVSHNLENYFLLLVCSAKTAMIWKKSSFFMVGD